MKKSLIALAVLAAFGGTAMAQTSVTVYGIVDAGVAFDRGGPNGNVSRLDGGIQSGSRLGFRGTEELTNDLSAIFTVEMGLSPDTGTSTQGGRTFGRQSFLGLKSNWGTLTLGRQYTPYVLTLGDVADPFSGGLAGRADNLMADTGTRMDNTVKLALPEWGGFKAELAYGFGENADSRVGRSYGASIGYANGPLAVGLAYHDRDLPATAATNDPATPTDESAAADSENTLLAASYDFNFAKIHLGLADNKGTNVRETRDRRSRDMVAGVSMPFGQSTVLVSYVRKDDRSGTNGDAEQWGLGYTYALSKRTNFYTSYARIDNDPGARYTVGNSMNTGTGDEQFNFGIRHTF